MEHLLDDSLKVPNLLGPDQHGERVCFGVALHGNVVHFETSKIVDESFGNVVVLEKHYLLGLIFLGNLSLGKLQVCVASQLLSFDFSC